MKITRYYPADHNLRNNFYFGNMHIQAHSIKEVFKKYGFYKEKFKIAADFEHLLKLIYINNENFKIINEVLIRMKTGGLSRKNFSSFITINKEILKSFEINGIKSNILRILIRVPLKLFQYIGINQNYLNKDFKLPISKYYEYYFYKKIKIINKIGNLNFRKNFVFICSKFSIFGRFI